MTKTIEVTEEKTARNGQLVRVILTWDSDALILRAIRPGKDAKPLEMLNIASFEPLSLDGDQPDGFSDDELDAVNELTAEVLAALQAKMRGDE